MVKCFENKQWYSKHSLLYATEQDQPRATFMEKNYTWDFNIMAKLKFDSEVAYHVSFGFCLAQKCSLHFLFLRSIVENHILNLLWQVEIHEKKG